MKRLTLFRHAKSDWDDPVARDFDRPLNKRGERAALLMGQFARAKAMRFDWLVASPAVRVVETLGTFLVGYGDPVETHWDRRIYLASVPTLLDVLRDLPETSETALLAGHNPGLEDLVLALVPARGDAGLRDDVEAKFPTASLAVIDLAIDRWADIDEDVGALAAFTRPRDLDPALGPASR